MSWGSTSFLWLVFFFGALLWGSIIHKHTGRWMWQRSASFVSWNWVKYSCHSKLVFNLVNATVVCSILESILGLEPSSVITEPRYLKLVTVSFPEICWRGLHQWPYHRGFWCLWGWCWCFTSSWLPSKLHAEPCRRPSWSPVSYTHLTLPTRRTV